MKISKICTGGLLAIAMAGAALAKTPSDWPLYGFDSLHDGVNDTESILGQRNVSQLGLAWSFSAGAYEAQNGLPGGMSTARFQAQPIVAANLNLPNGITELVLAGDQNGYFYALDGYSSNPKGTVVWVKSLGTVTLANCGGSPRTTGIRSTAALDRSANGGNGAVYIGVNGQVHALDLATGAELNGWPVAVPTPMNTPTEGYIHDAPNVVNGKLYIGTSSCNDQPPYFGRVVEIDTGSATVQHLWYSLSGNATPPGQSGGGVWGWGGVAVDPDAKAGGVYVATGNARTGALTQTPFAEYVVNLSPDLSQLVGFATPAIPNGDFDYGSTPMVFQPTVCGTKLVAALNKTGLLVVASVQGDGSLKLMQSLQIMSQSAGELNSNAAWSLDTQQVLVTTLGDGPAPFVHGLTALSVDANCGTTGAPLLAFAWQTTKNQSGNPLMPAGQRISAPTVADKMVFLGVAGSTPAVYAIANQTTKHATQGQVMWQSPALGCSPAWPITVINGRLFVECEGSKSLLNAYAIPGF